MGSSAGPPAPIPASRSSSASAPPGKRRVRNKATKCQPTTATNKKAHVNRSGRNTTGGKTRKQTDSSERGRTERSTQPRALPPPARSAPGGGRGPMRGGAGRCGRLRRPLFRSLPAAAGTFPPTRREVAGRAKPGVGGMLGKGGGGGVGPLLAPLPCCSDNNPAAPSRGGQRRAGSPRRWGRRGKTERPCRGCGRRQAGAPAGMDPAAAAAVPLARGAGRGRAAAAAGGRAAAPGPPRSAPPRNGAALFAAGPRGAGCGSGRFGAAARGKGRGSGSPLAGGAAGFALLPAGRPAARASIVPPPVPVPPVPPVRSEMAPKPTARSRRL